MTIHPLKTAQVYKIRGLIKKLVFSEIMLVFLMVLVAYGYFSPNAFSFPDGQSFLTLDWNANSRLSLVKAFVEEGRFEIDSYHETGYLQTGDKAYFNGHYYSDKAIGSSLLGIEFYAPIYAISNHFGYPLDDIIFQELLVFLAISLVCAFLAPLVYSFVKSISGNPGYSLLIAIAVSLGTPLFFYSTVYYGHSLAGTFIFVAFFLWFHMKNEEKTSHVKIFISGYLLGFAFITEYATAVISFLIGLYILSVARRQKNLFRPRVYILLVLGGLIPLSIFLMYNQVVFQNPFATGYSNEALPQFSGENFPGFMGIGLPNLKVLFYMTFHTTMGIFWQCPFLLLAFVGWIVMWRNFTYRAEAFLSFSIIFMYLIMFSGYFIWWGGSAFTPRFIIPMLPFFAVPLAFLPRKTYVVAGVLILISVAQMFIVTASAPGGLGNFVYYISNDNYYPMFKNSSIYSIYFPNFLERKLVTNRGIELLGLRNFRSLLPLFMIEVTLLIIFIRSTSAPFFEKFAQFHDKLQKTASSQDDFV
jgi:hypothetical protein